MLHPFDRTHCDLVFAEEYLNYFPARGRAVHFRHLGLTFFGLSNCLCLGGTFQAVAPYEKSGLTCIFKESCPYIANEPDLAATVETALQKATEFVELDEAVPLFPRGVDNLWHFTFESLPKVLALESAGYAGQYIVPANAGSDGDKVIMPSLALFGIAPERIKPSGPAYLVRRMMLPQRLNGFDLPENIPLTGFLRQRLLEAVGGLPGGKRLYIRRTGRRKLANEAEVLPVLEDFGFETMVPEKLTLAEEWRCMTNVDCTVMMHGAGTTLTLLQKPASGFIELFGNRYVSYSNLHTVRLLRLRYHALMEELTLASYPDERTPLDDFISQGFYADIAVDPLHLRILLEAMLEKA